MPIQELVHNAVPLPSKLIIRGAIPKVLIESAITEVGEFGIAVADVFEDEEEEDEGAGAIWTDAADVELCYSSHSARYEVIGQRYPEIAHQQVYQGLLSYFPP